MQTIYLVTELKKINNRMRNEAYEVYADLECFASPYEASKAISHYLEWNGLSNPDLYVVTMPSFGLNIDKFILTVTPVLPSSNGDPLPLEYRLATPASKWLEQYPVDSNTITLPAQWVKVGHVIPDEKDKDNEYVVINIIADRAQGFNFNGLPIETVRYAFLVMDKYGHIAEITRKHNDNVNLIATARDPKEWHYLDHVETALSNGLYPDVLRMVYDGVIRQNRKRQ